MTQPPRTQQTVMISVELRTRLSNAAIFLRNSHLRCGIESCQADVIFVSETAHICHHHTSQNKNTEGYGNDECNRRALGSCMRLIDNGWTSNLRGPGNIFGPALRKPPDHLVVFARGESLAVIVEPIEEAPVASGQAAQRCQADRARLAVRGSASNEI